MKTLSHRHKTIEEDAKAGDGREGSIVARFTDAHEHDQQDVGH